MILIKYFEAEMKNLMKLVLIGVMILTFVNCGDSKKEESAELKKKIDQYAKTVIKYDENLLDDRQKVVVKKLYQAAKIMDDIFLDQFINIFFHLFDKGSDSVSLFSKFFSPVMDRIFFRVLFPMEGKRPGKNS